MRYVTVMRTWNFHEQWLKKEKKYMQIKFFEQDEHASRNSNILFIKCVKIRILKPLKLTSGARHLNYVSNTWN